jgi:hypothetical protein
MMSHDNGTLVIDVNVSWSGASESQVIKKWRKFFASSVTSDPAIAESASE